MDGQMDKLKGRIKPRKEDMLYAFAGILLVLWLLGLISSYTMGGYIHILLVISVIVVIIQFMTCRKVVKIGDENEKSK
jgi:uncharacterized protein (DUF58 family)